MIEAGEERGWIEPAELEAFALEHELADVDVEELTRELERIGLEVRDRGVEEDRREKAEEIVYEADQPSGAGGDPRQADRARGRAREAAHDRVEPAARRLDREGVPWARRAVPRPDPGGHPGAEPRGREVRLAPRLQVLDVRDVVDPPVGAARGRKPRADDPRAGARGRAPAEALAGGAPARGRAWARADEGRARRGDGPSDSARGRGAERGVRVRLAEPDGGRGRRGRARRPLRRPRGGRPVRRGRGVAAQAEHPQGARRAAGAGAADPRAAVRVRGRAVDARGDRPREIGRA